MSIAKVMTTDLIVVEMDDPMSKIIKIFETNKFHHLLVVDSGVLVGVISDRDVLANCSPTVNTRKQTTKDTSLLNQRAHQFMTKHPFTLKEEAGIFDVITAFYKKRISCLPIIDGNHRPIGIITTHDIMKTLYKQHMANVKPV